MPSTKFQIERLLPCACLALADAPFAACPECGGDGATYQEIILAIEYGHWRDCRGARDLYGAPLEPDDPEEYEIQSVTDERGVEVELTERETERAKEKCIRDALESRIDALYDRYED